MSLGQNFRDANALQGMPLGMLTKTVLLVADNTAIDVAGTRLLLLSSDNTTAANRTFTLVGSTLVGHELTIIFTSAGSTTAQLADTGIQRLQADWEPVQYDSIELLSDGTNWVERARAGTSLVPADGVTNAKIADGAVSLEHLDAGITTAMRVIAGGLFTTVGGDATETITATGALATDTVVVTINTKGAVARTMVAAVGATDSITVTLSGDPSTDHVLNYLVFRATA